MVPRNALSRTFQIKVNGVIGSSFAIDIDSRQYLVTAKHVVPKIQQKDTIKIWHDRAWRDLDVEVVGLSDHPVDVAVFTTNRELPPRNLPCPPTGDADLFLSQSLYFLGFPYELKMEFGEMNGGYPIPFVKQGMISCFHMEQNRTTSFYLDGHNNPGFSGGPVVLCDATRNVFKFAGIVSAYRKDWLPVIHKGGADTEYLSKYNTGLVLVYHINHVTRLVAQNAIGFAL